MASPSLSDRVRAALQTGRLPERRVESHAPISMADCSGGEDSIEATLGGTCLAESRRCFVIDRSGDPDTKYGRYRIGEMAEILNDVGSESSLLAGAAAEAPFRFFDLETTGLSGGAGTCPFLIGIGWFDRSGSFFTRQFLLTDPSDEHQLLDAVGRELQQAGTLVSFNGKSFDAPLLEMRHAFHRLDWTDGAGRLPHLDVLHPSRRFWGFSDGADCSLIGLERQILGIARAGDVPGFEIPARYFHFLRTGDARPLRPVLDHNRRDLVSLAAVTARLLHLVRNGPRSSEDANEALALGKAYARAGLVDRAVEAFEQTLDYDPEPPMAAEALRSLALTLRRARRFDEAARAWLALLELPGCPARRRQEATTALAIHHEHRARDLARAHGFAAQCLVEHEGRRSWAESARYRLARIERKLKQASAQPEDQRGLL